MLGCQSPQFQSLFWRSGIRQWCMLLLQALGGTHLGHSMRRLSTAFLVSMICLFTTMQDKWARFLFDWTSILVQLLVPVGRRLKGILGDGSPVYIIHNLWSKDAQKTSTHNRRKTKTLKLQLANWKQAQYTNTHTHPIQTKVPQFPALRSEVSQSLHINS